MRTLKGGPKPLNPLVGGGKMFQKPVMGVENLCGS
jgi:hypothetical protein